MTGAAGVALVVLGTGLAVVLVVRHEARRTRALVAHLMRAAGIEAPDGAGTRSHARTSPLGKGESRSVRDSEALTPALRGNGADHETTRALAGLAGMRAEQER